MHHHYSISILLSTKGIQTPPHLRDLAAPCQSCRSASSSGRASSAATVLVAHITNINISISYLISNFLQAVPLRDQRESTEPVLIRIARTLPVFRCADESQELGWHLLGLLHNTRKLTTFKFTQNVNKVCISFISSSIPRRPESG